MLPKTTFEKISHHINSCPSHLGASAAAAAWRQKSTLTGRIPPLNGPFRCRPISHHFRVEEQVSQQQRNHNHPLLCPLKLLQRLEHWKKQQIQFVQLHGSWRASHLEKIGLCSRLLRMPILNLL